jgi:hypothetical protein
MNFRKAARTPVIETGLPSDGQGEPFIFTKNWREVEKLTWASWIFTFFPRR